MSRRRTVKVARLEGRADECSDIRHALRDLLIRRGVDRSVCASVNGMLFEREVRHLRELARAQREQEAQRAKAQGDER